MSEQDLFHSPSLTHEISGTSLDNYGDTTNNNLRMIHVQNVFASLLVLPQTLQIALDTILYHKQQLFIYL